MAHKKWITKDRIEANLADRNKEEIDFYVGSLLLSAIFALFIVVWAKSMLFTKYHLAAMQHTWYIDKSSNLREDTSMTYNIPEYTYTASKDGVKASVKFKDAFEIAYSAGLGGVTVATSFGKREDASKEAK
jgi:hypothetical protein